jgi:hypothetical protein
VILEFSPIATQILLIKLNDGVQQVAMLQDDLIGNQLMEWKRRQKLAQIGVPFDEREEMLHNIQTQWGFWHILKIYIFVKI